MRPTWQHPQVMMCLAMSASLAAEANTDGQHWWTLNRSGGMEKQKFRALATSWIDTQSVPGSVRTQNIESTLA